MDPKGNQPSAPLSGGFEFDFGPVGSLRSANLTPDKETGIGRRTDAELARVLQSGVLPDGQLSIFMRYSASRLSSDDIVAVISYLRSQPAVRNAVKPPDMTMFGKAMFSFMKFAPRLEAPPALVPPSDQPSVARGAYLAENVTKCVECHGKYDQMSMVPVGPKAGGSDPGPSPANDGKVFIAPNLTSHATGKTGQLTEDEFVNRIRAGRVYPASIMPWEDMGRVSESDLRSIYRYLHSLPPVDNDVGLTYREG